MDPWLNSSSFWHGLPMCAPLVGPAAHARHDPADLGVLVASCCSVVAISQRSAAQNDVIVALGA
jgi:hypothetical protein